jgi:hypothetical protein
MIMALNATFNNISVISWPVRCIWCRSHDRMVVGFTTICAISELWVRFKLTAKCIRYNILWSSLSVTCDKSIWISLGLQFSSTTQTRIKFFFKLQFLNYLYSQTTNDETNSSSLFLDGSAYNEIYLSKALDLTTHTSLSPIRCGFAPSFVNYKKGALDLQPQVT